MWERLDFDVPECMGYVEQAQAMTPELFENDERVAADLEAAIAAMS